MYYFLGYTIAYIISILLCLYLNFKIAIMCSIISFVILSFFNKKILANFIIVLLTILSILSIRYSRNSILSEFIGEDLYVNVKVKSVNKSENESDFISYNVEVCKIKNEEISEKSILYVSKDKALMTNCVYRINVNIADLQESKNFYMYNYKNSMRSKRIYATLFQNTTPKLLEKNYSKVNKIVAGFKEKVENLFYRNMKKENANILLSIILGDKGYLDKDLYKNIQKVGIAHVFAVSGLHIGILYTFIFNIFNHIGFSRRISWSITWCILWFYGFMIGFPISVVRALIMFTILYGSELLYRKYSSINSVVISALVMLIINPYYLFDAGFQLSYLAVIGLIIFNNIIKPRLKIKNNIVSDMCLYVFLQILTFPILSYYFNYMSIIGLLYNLLMVPLFTLIIVIAFLLIPLGFIGLYAGYFIKVFYLILDLIPMKCIDYMFNTIKLLIDLGSNTCFSGVIVPTMKLTEICFYYVFLIVICYIVSYKNYKYTIITNYIFLMFYILNIIIIPLNYTGLQLNIADAGQGLFTVVSYENNNYVFDAGSKQKNLGQYVCSPYLMKRGISSVEAIFISHWHDDHYSGVNDILDTSFVHKVYTSSSDEKHLIKSDTVVLKAGNFAKLNKKSKLSILWPDDKYKDDNENNMSNVYLLEGEGLKILFAGDIEGEVEEKLLDRLTNIDILVVPHHGSKTSSSDNFVKKLNPKLCIFSYGINNYGIPSGDVLKRYKKCGSTILSTFYDGEINILAKNGKIYYNTYKGKCSENMSEIYKYIFINNFILFFSLMIIIIRYNKYISDKSNELMG